MSLKQAKTPIWGQNEFVTDYVQRTPKNFITFNPKGKDIIQVYVLFPFSFPTKEEYYSDKDPITRVHQIKAKSIVYTQLVRHRVLCQIYVTVKSVFLVSMHTNQFVYPCDSLSMHFSCKQVEGCMYTYWSDIYKLRLVYMLR